MSDELPTRRVDGNGITRREMLQRLGLVGGSSLVLGAMNAFDLMAEPIGPKPVLRSTQEGVRVLVLGAGISGLITAYELEKVGYDVGILEARQRVGGLTWTVSRGSSHTELGPGGEKQVCDFDEGQHFNAGAWRIPHRHHGILGYCRDLGVRLEQFNDQASLFYGEDPSLGELAGRKLRLPELKSDLWGQTSELLAKVLDQGALDGAMDAEDRERLLEFLVRAGYLESPDLVYRPDPEARGAEGKYDLSVLLSSPFARYVRSVNRGTGGPAPVFQPTGGMMQISLAFERVLGERITFGAEVVSVRQSDDEVRVVYENTRSGDRREVAAEYVISCLPMRILKKLDVDFSPEMQQAVDASSHSSSSKMGVQMGRRFWEEDDEIYGGHLIYVPAAEEGDEGRYRRRRSPIPQFSYPSNDYGSKKGVLLAFYGNGDMPGLDGKPLSESPIRSRIDYVRTHASVPHPQFKDELESAYCVWWPKVPYSEGAWASNPRNRMEQLSKADGRIYVGSAGVSSHPAWQEGAVESAWRVVETLHQRVSAG